MIRKSILFLGFRIEVRCEILLRADQQLNVIKLTNYGKNMKKNRAYITRLLFNLKTLKNSYVIVQRARETMLHIHVQQRRSPALHPSFQSPALCLA